MHSCLVIVLSNHVSCRNADLSPHAGTQVSDATWEGVWAPAHWTQDGDTLDCVAAQLGTNTATTSPAPFAGAWLDVSCATALPYWCVGDAASFAAPPPWPPTDGTSPPPPPSPPPPFAASYPAYPQGGPVQAGGTASGALSFRGISPAHEATLGEA